MKLNPYLNFDGNAEEAFKFYQSVFGGEMFIQKMDAAPGTEGLSKEEKNRVMHVSIPIGDGQFVRVNNIQITQERNSTNLHGKVHLTNTQSSLLI